MEDQLQLIKSDIVYNLIVKKPLEEKIRFLCEKLPNNEWSGTLFYTVKGTFAKGDLCIVCEDLYLQNIGSSTYTEFQNDVSLAGYLAEHSLWDCYTGLIHSHNRMATFFSATDISTLKEKGAVHNHFVSLIVNNIGEYNAVITRKIQETFRGRKSVSYNSFDNVVVKGKTASVEESSQYIEYFSLDITIEEFHRNKSELELRYEELYESYNTVKTKPYLEKPVSESKPINTYYNYRDYIDDDYEDSAQKSKEVSPVLQLFEDSYGDDNVVKEIVTQLITGDIFSIYKQNIDLDKWVSNMENLYNKRFPPETPEKVSEEYSYWIQTLVCGLEDYYGEDNFYNMREAIVKYLEKYPTNKYLQELINLLK